LRASTILVLADNWVYLVGGSLPKKVSSVFANPKSDPGGKWGWGIQSPPPMLSRLTTA